MLGLRGGEVMSVSTRKERVVSSCRGKSEVEEGEQEEEEEEEV